MTEAITVIFDLDGTLVDSWDAHVHCLREVSRSLFGASLSLLKILASQAATDYETLSNLFDGSFASSALEVYEHSLSQYLQTNTVALMPGVTRFLDFLLGMGVPFGVCTGRSRLSAEMLASAAGLSLPHMVCGDDVKLSKPSPDGLLQAIALLGSNPHRAIWIGDSTYDEIQGRQAGVLTFLVGARSASMPESSCFHVEQIDELIAALGGRFDGSFTTTRSS